MDHAQPGEIRWSNWGSIDLMNQERIHRKQQGFRCIGETWLKFWYRHGHLLSQGDARTGHTGYQTALERICHNWKGFKDFNLTSKASIWP